MKKICVVTGARAEYGLLYWLMKGIQEDSELELEIIATGMHMSPEFGLTYREIEKDGFTINKKVEIVISKILNKFHQIDGNIFLSCVFYFMGVVGNYFQKHLKMHMLEYGKYQQCIIFLFYE